MPKELAIEAIDKLEAGRELDALVAEKVMEWRCRIPEHYNALWEHHNPEPYSTSISAAWEVLPDTPYDIDATVPEFGVDFTFHLPSGSVKGTGDTVMLARCRAALNVALKR